MPATAQDSDEFDGSKLYGWTAFVNGRGGESEAQPKGGEWQRKVFTAPFAFTWGRGFTVLATESIIYTRSIYDINVILWLKL